MSNHIIDFTVPGEPRTARPRACIRGDKPGMHEEGTFDNHQAMPEGFECTCEKCGSRFVFPENIEDKIRAYLLGKGYELYKDNLIETFYKPNQILHIRMRSCYRDKTRRSRSLIGIIGGISVKENRPPQIVLSDILYDNEAKVKYLKWQLAFFSHQLTELTEDDWVNRMQVESKIDQLKEQISELEKKL